MAQVSQGIDQKPLLDPLHESRQRGREPALVATGQEQLGDLHKLKAWDALAILMSYTNNSTKEQAVKKGKATATA